MIRRLKGDFKLFLWAMWRYLELPDPTPIQYDIATYLDKGPRRRIALASRGVGKSWETVALVLHRLFKDPQTRVLVVSASEEHAVDFTTFLLQIIDRWDLVQHLRPPPERRSKLKFDVGPAKAAKAASVMARGIDGGLQGPRANLIVGDDIESIKNSETTGKRAKIRKRVAEFSSILSPGGEVVLLGTPQCEESLYSDLGSVTSDGTVGYDVCIWPIIVPTPEQARKYGGRLAPWIQKMTDEGKAGQSAEPTRFPLTELDRLIALEGRTYFQLQFLLDTTLSDEDRYPLRLLDAIVMPLDLEQGPGSLVWGPTSDNELPDLVCRGRSSDRWHGPATIPGKEVGAYFPWETTIMAVDPSGRGADETAAWVIKQLNGRLFVADLAAMRNGYDEASLVTLANLAKKHGVREVVYESNFGDGMWERVASPVFAKIHRTSFTEFRSNTMKEARIADALEPVLNSHRLVFAREVIELDNTLCDHYSATEGPYYSAIYQLTRLRREKACLKHDDRLDALALGVSHLKEAAAVDVNNAMQRKQQDADEALLERIEHRMNLHSPPSQFTGDYSSSGWSFTGFRPQ
ncbi:UNVERIFIED_CONTAM: hypothetical protein GTU68_066869 [Idotea baltica]|nr:hypothetical protein [Idotea baltica]